MTDTKEKNNSTSTPKKATKEDNKTPVATSVQVIDNFKIKIKEFFSSWKVKLALIITILVGIFTLIFFWQHIVAVWGMKTWSSRSGAIPIECMIKDTNDDHYISCSAIRDEQIIPLECGINVLNLGCRVNYGTAASPPVSGRK